MTPRLAFLLFDITEAIMTVKAGATRALSMSPDNRPSFIVKCLSVVNFIRTVFAKASQEGWK